MGPRLWSLGFHSLHPHRKKNTHFSSAHMIYPKWFLEHIFSDVICLTFEGSRSGGNMWGRVGCACSMCVFVCDSCCQILFIYFLFCFCCLHWKHKNVLSMQVLLATVSKEPIIIIFGRTLIQWKNADGFDKCFFRCSTCNGRCSILWKETFKSCNLYHQNNTIQYLESTKAGLSFVYSM